MRTEKFYRAAEKGLKKMNCGSFYSPCDETAGNYVGIGDELYSFDFNVSLFPLDDYKGIWDFDLGLSEIFEILSENNVNVNDVFEKFDGVRINCGNTWLVIIFGNVDVESSVITKYSFDDMIKEDELNEILK